MEWSMNPLIPLIKLYYQSRKLKWPNFDSAMKFVMTELAEVYELDLAREDGWVRNHPENKPKYSREDMAEELGDAIMMLIVAGIAEEVDPLQALEDKIKSKLEKQTKTATLSGNLINIE